MMSYCVSPRNIKYCVCVFVGGGWGDLHVNKRRERENEAKEIEDEGSKWRKWG